MVWTRLHAGKHGIREWAESSTSGLSGSKKCTGLSFWDIKDLVTHLLQQSHTNFNNAMPPNSAVPYGLSIQYMSLQGPFLFKLPNIQQIFDNLPSTQLVMNSSKHIATWCSIVQNILDTVGKKGYLKKKKLCGRTRYDFSSKSLDKWSMKDGYLLKGIYKICCYLCQPQISVYH